MSNARTIKRWGWLTISVGLASACVLPDYDHGLGSRGPAHAGNAGSAHVNRASGASFSSATGGNSNSGGAAGAAFAGMVSSATVAGSTSQTPFSNAGRSAQGAATASSLPTQSAGAFNTGGAGGTGSSVVDSGGVTSSSVNASGTSSTESGNNLGGSNWVGSNSGGTTSIIAAGAPGTGGVAGASITLPCPSGRGPDMVRVPEGYCIDKTEVTEGQYAAWIATLPEATPANQRAECAWNRTYESSSLRDVANFPITAIDWCDAAAFCTWANKRLCGAIAGGAQNYFTGSASNESQWYNACSAHGTNVYPYSGALDNTRCNAGNAGLDSVAPVGEFNLCTSSAAGYTEIFDMSGNVAEWLDSCNGPEASDFCRTAGGSYIIGVDPDPRCGLPAYEFRNNWYYNVGFRCCAE